VTKFSLGGELILRERHMLGKLGTRLARSEARSKGAAEALILDSEGFLLACTGGEILPVREGCIWLPESPFQQGTYKLLQDALAGIGVKSNVQRLKMRDLKAATECLLLSDYWEVQPVATIDGATIGAEGKAGQLAQTIASGLQSKLRNDAKPIF
jgi:branched-chain amino acid aminotransferase